MFISFSYEFAEEKHFILNYLMVILRLFEKIISNGSAS
jgi:hypothetical protein